MPARAEKHKPVVESLTLEQKCRFAGAIFAVWLEAISAKKTTEPCTQAAVVAGSRKEIGGSG